MKSLLALPLLGLLAASLHATPLHPTVLVVNYKPNPLPVVKVIETDPVVIVDGKEKRIRTEPQYRLDRAKSFGKGFVTFGQITFDGIPLEDVNAPKPEKSKKYADPNNRVRQFQTTVKSKLALPGGFIVITAFPEGIGYSLLRDTSVHQLPDLLPGQEAKVDFAVAILRDADMGGHKLNYVVQVFDGNGYEVMSSELKYASSYFAAGDRLQLLEVIDGYKQKFAGQDHSLVPYIQPPPVFPEDFIKPEQPATATLTISADGVVTAVVIDGLNDAALRQSYMDALSGWLFLPRLKAGVAVPAKVKLPLQF